MNKIFGIGLSKTGTTSLADALQILGFSIADYPNDSRTLAQLRAGDYDLDVVRKNDGMTDTPAALCYQQLDTIFPGSKFILTERADRSRWLQSVQGEWDFGDEWAKASPGYLPFRDFITIAVYGLRGFNADRISMVYDRHAREVREYFADRPEDLLILDVTSGHGWPELCTFLGVDEPGRDYPHSNSKAEKAYRRELIEKISVTDALLARFVPTGAKIALLDDSGLTYSTIEEKWDCQHLVVHDDAVIGGNPHDDEHAVRCLDLAKQRGIEALLLWKPGSAWWHDAYPSWSKKLAEDYEMLAENEDVALYRV